MGNRNEFNRTPVEGLNQPRIRPRDIPEEIANPGFCKSLHDKIGIALHFVPPRKPFLFLHSIHASDCQSGSARLHVYIFLPMDVVFPSSMID
jgi:hypothetical protein